MSVTVKIPAPLRPLTGGLGEIQLDSATVGDAFGQIEARYPGFSAKVLDDGKTVRRFINVFVNEDNIRDKKDLATEVRKGDIVSILPSIAGGKGRR
jgi:molybdopterin synthase sulfur carrier subunit